MVACSSQLSLARRTVQPVGSEHAIRRRAVLASISAVSGTIGIRRGLICRRVAGIIQLIEQVLESIGNPLLDNVVVNTLEDIAQPPLVFAT
jgi:hypothetical protein